MIPESEWIPKCPGLTIHPAINIGEKIEWTPIGATGYADKRTNLNLTIDLNRLYSEDIIIYQSHGGGDDSQQCINYFIVDSRISRIVKKELNRLPKSYLAIHLRGSDFIGLRHDDSNSIEQIERAIESLAKKLEGYPLFVATDSKSVLEICKRKINGSNFYNYSGDLIEDDNSLHHIKNVSPLRKHDLNTATFIDLALLSFGNNVILAWANQNGWTSGFGRLAQFLSKDHQKRHRFFNLPT